ncbi:MAG: sigma-54-dependent Fis family transcriptional regulator [Desulfovibrio sp.]|nr:sigma-54-dependent Fis family transcriptional regulator [Desulfovibrio sp.]
MANRRILFLMPAQAVTSVFPPLRDAGYEVGIAENLKGAQVFIRKSEPCVIFARPQLPGFRIEDLLAVAQAEEHFPPVVVATDAGNAQEAERLLNMGAKDYWLEPLDPNRILTMVREPGKAVPIPAKTTLGGHKPSLADNEGPRIVGRHTSMIRVLALAKQVAPSKATVLIMGESGTGKEMFARYLHAMSKRSAGPFIAVNCAALPEHLLESELFGHEKGAFTGAIARKLGKFELASGGTLLLDEISEMDLPLQAKLLRVLQEGEVDRVGGAETVKVDVRVLATTNRNLEDWVKQGKFRQDLYFRLNVIPLRLPALHERGNDVLDLAQFFVNMYVREYSLPPMTLSQRAIDWLKAYAFPGNVRELQNLMERAVLLANGHPIEPCHFLLENAEWPLFEEETVGDSGQDPSDSPSFESTLREANRLPKDERVVELEEEGASTNQAQKDPSDPLAAFTGPVIPLHEMERIMIIKGLQVTSGNRTQAAEMLGISVRTLRNKLNEYRSMGKPVD